MTWQWADVRAAVDGSDRQFDSFLLTLPRSEIERLIYSESHWRNVVGNFDVDDASAARMIYSEIKRRGVESENQDQDHQIVRPR